MEDVSEIGAQLAASQTVQGAQISRGFLPGGPRPAGTFSPCQGNCFVCGNGQPGNLSVHRSSFDGDTLHAQFTVTDAHLGGPGMAHGGALAAALDEVLGSRAWLLGHDYVTAKLELNYLAPVPIGTQVHISARCTRTDGRKAIIEADAHLNDPNGAIAVRATGLFIAISVTRS